MNFIQKPLLDFLGLDRYLDSYGKFIRLPSRGDRSDEGKVNRQLREIELKNGQYAYLRNRVRDSIASLILGKILPGASIFPSEIKNDILYHTDAIAIEGGKTFAIDFTTDFYSLEKKLHHLDSDGNGYLIGPDGRGVKLPFMVVYISSELIDSIIGGIKDNLNEGLPRPDIMNNVVSNISRIYQQDMLPTLLSTAHSFGQGDSSGLVTQIKSNTLHMGGIHILGLDQRPLAGLREMGINTIGELCEKSSADIMKSLDLGVKSIHAIKVALEKFNLFLKPNIPVAYLPSHEFETR